MSESILKFIDYKIDSINFKFNKGFAPQDEEVQIKIHLDRGVDVKEDGKFQLNLNLSLGSAEDTQPFKLDVVLMALFKTTDEVENLIDNATAIMYPYLRNVVSGITTICNIPTITMPVVNITEMFNEQEKNKNRIKKS